MVQYSLLFACLFVISLNICVTRTQLEKNRNDLFGMDSLDISNEESESVTNLKEDSRRLLEAKLCSSNSDCFHGGQCTKNGTCSCLKGTNGTLCENAIECMKHPDMCGNGTDVKCVFDVKSESTMCQCADKKKVFNYYAERCAELCQTRVKNETVRRDCGIYGRCVNSFCVCVGGVSGDFCETVDQCEEMDCGKDPSIVCTLGVDGAYCKCNEVDQVFDQSDKVCKEPCEKYVNHQLVREDCGKYGSCSNRVCVCMKGASGDRCEIIDQCANGEVNCTGDPSATCSLGISGAYCECNKTDQLFDKKEKRCKEVCEHDEDCGLYGSCDRYGFCRCLEGVSGDYCKTIEKCQKMDCGIRTNCTLGSDGEAHCKCLDFHLVFDYESKTCKTCECGDNSKGCEFRDGKKTCKCALNYFRNGNKCEACNCGEVSKGCELRDGKKECFCPLNYTTIGDTCQKCSCGIGSYHCRMEGGKKKCVCYEPYKQRKNECEFCDCGIHGGECSFTESGEKQCICKLGFKMAKETGFCKQMCNDTNPCQNGGLCQEGLCKCHEDYAGAWCETPKWCLNSRCGNSRDEVECIWDKRKREGRCQCKEPHSLYQERDRSCVECDCGSNGHCIMTALGEKVCICDEGYADYLLKCKRCDCGLFSTNCSFQMSEKKLCQCEEGRIQRNSKTFWGDETSSCDFCYCGEYGMCHFDGKDKVCDCEENYKVFDGFCRECSCGPYGFCSFDSVGKKVCTCDFGYSVYEGRCERCDCEPPNLRGIGTVCLFEGHERECHCPRGYESPKNDFCDDINECLNATACPANTDCENLPGSYKCFCKKGFKVRSLGLDPKKFGCEDINECAEHPCTDPNTACLNTPGSYDCQCLKGYYPTSATSGLYYNPKYATCNKEVTQWRGASIALGVILSIGIVGVGGYIFYQRRGYRR